MIQTTNHGQYRSRHSRAGEALSGGLCCAEAPADRQASNEPHFSSTARCLTHTSLCITGGSFGSRLFPITLRSGPLAVERHKRQIGEVLLPRTRSVAALSRRLIGSRLQFRRIGHKPGSYHSDPCELHLELHSSAVGFDRDQHGKGRFANGRKVVVGERNV